MRETAGHIAVILLVSGTVFFTNLGKAKLWDRDEPRNAGCAAEMMARGDWVVPMFNDELRHQKPALLYWLMMSAYSVVGVNEFSARFWSAALAIGTSCMTYVIARRLANPKIAFLAAIALSTSLMFDVAALAATPDSVLIFCTTAALMIYVGAVFEKTEMGLKPKQAGNWFPTGIYSVISFYVMLGMGMLAKGLIGFVMPMAIIGMFMLIQRLPPRESSTEAASTMISRLFRKAFSIVRPLHPIHFLSTFWSMRPVLGTLISLLIAGPWFLLVHARTEGDFTWLFFVGEHFGRATTVMENHRGGLWYYPVAILVGFFPWSALWGPMAIATFKNRVKSNGTTMSGPALTFLLCWIGVQVGLFSVVQTKLPSYVTPCYPALAILSSMCLLDFAFGCSRVARFWFYAAFAGLVLTGVGILGGVGYATSRFLPDQIGLAALGIVPLVGGTILIWMLSQNRISRLPHVFAGMSVLFCLGLFGFGTVSLDSEQESLLVLNKLDTEHLVGSYGCLESSWVFYSRRTIYEINIGPLNGDTEPTDGHALTQPNSSWRRKPKVSVETMLNADPNAMLITSSDHVEELKEQLPEDYEVLQTANYFLKNKEIVLLGRRGEGRRSEGRQSEQIEQMANRPTEQPLESR